MAKPYDPKDFYYRKAKKQGLRARSAFKIDEILRRHRLLRKGDAVLDLLAPDALPRIRELHPGRFDLVTSDMAPKTIGVKVSDEARSLELVRMALAVAEATLAPGGAFVAKVFMGGDFPVLQKELKARFERVQVVRPQATRESSYEVYVLGTGYRRPEIR